MGQNPQKCGFLDQKWWKKGRFFGSEKSGIDFKVFASGVVEKKSENVKLKFVIDID